MRAKLEDSTVKLELIEVYYIRQLLRQNLDRLESVVIEGGGPSINPLSDLNYVIQQLYLDEAEAQSTVAELQQLAKIHKSINHGSHLNRYRLREIETRIFWLFGFKEKKPGHQELILLVDDQITNLKLLEAFLTHQGYHVATASNGEQAIDQARTLLPEVILLDLWMPGIDGFTVCEKLKANPLTDAIPIIFVTSNADTSAKVQAYEIGGADYVTRPFELEEVLARLEYQLRLCTLQKRLAAQNEALQQRIHGQEYQAQKYQQFFEQAVDGMYQISADGTYLEANLALARIYGYASVEQMELATHNNAGQLYVEGDRHQQLITSIQVTGHIVNFESAVYQANGNLIWISENARIVHDAAGNFLYYEGTVRDITQYKTYQHRT